MSQYCLCTSYFNCHDVEREYKMTLCFIKLTIQLTVIICEIFECVHFVQGVAKKGIIDVARELNRMSYCSVWSCDHLHLASRDRNILFRVNLKTTKLRKHF